MKEPLNVKLAVLPAPGALNVVSDPTAEGVGLLSSLVRISARIVPVDSRLYTLELIVMLDADWLIENLTAPT